MDNLLKEYLARWPHDEPSAELLEQYRMKPKELKNPKKRKGHLSNSGQTVSENNSPSIDDDMVRCTDEEARERALAHLDQLLLKRLKEWFCNHGRVTSNKTQILVANSSVAITGSSKVLSLGAKKVSQSWQAYFSKYRTRLQPLVDEDWQTHRGSLPQSEKPHWISFFQKWCKDKLAEEPDSVKKEVEEYRQSYNEFEDPAESHDEKLLRYQQAQNKVYRTLETAADAIEIQTGWSSLIMAGGPEVKAGGELKVIASCAGEIEGKTFAEWLGVARYGELQKWFSDFLNEKYGDSINTGLWTTNPSAEITGSARGDNGSDSEDSGSEDSDVEENANKNITPSAREADYLAPLEQRQAYAREKEACTARTKELLAQMQQEFHQGLADAGMRPPILGFSAVKPQETEPKSWKPRSKKVSEPPSRKSVRLQVESNSNTSSDAPSVLDVQTSKAVVSVDHENHPDEGRVDELSGGASEVNDLLGFSGEKPTSDVIPGRDNEQQDNDGTVSGDTTDPIADVVSPQTATTDSTAAPSSNQLSPTVVIADVSPQTATTDSAATPS
ncbi:hypothetical protein CVT24_002392, partial [Panaeolus cyanescens]